MTTRDGGKGDTPRPLSVDKETFDKRWDDIFNKSKPDENETQLHIEADNDHIEILATIPFGR